jgi:hypothetical protein
MHQHQLLPRVYSKVGILALLTRTLSSSSLSSSSSLLSSSWNIAGGKDSSTADEDISDYELDLIYDRQKIFPTFDCAIMKESSFSSSSMKGSLSTASLSSAATTSDSIDSIKDEKVKVEEGDSLIPIEGAMYDIITVEQGGGILGGM